jgi:sugar-specific transcriptional regulator TrmB
MAQRKRRDAEKQAREFERQRLANLEEQTDALRQELWALQEEYTVTAELKQEIERLKNEKLVAASGGQPVNWIEGNSEEADTADTNAEPAGGPTPGTVTQNNDLSLAQDVCNL